MFRDHAHMVLSAHKTRCKAHRRAILGYWYRLLLMANISAIGLIVGLGLIVYPWITPWLDWSMALLFECLGFAVLLGVMVLILSLRGKYHA